MKNVWMWVVVLVVMMTTVLGASRFGPNLDPLWKPEVSLASAATTDIGATASENVNITGVVTITSFGSSGNSGMHRWVRFAGALTLTHNATSLILPTGANIVTVAGDRMELQSLGSGNWLCRYYQRADGQAAGGGGYTMTLLMGVSFNPADATVYYIGGDPGAPRGAYTNGWVRIPKAGTLKNVSIRVNVTGTLGSNETVVHSIRLNDTTDISVGNLTYDTAQTQITTDTSTAVVAGDLVTLKLAATTWATNPTAVRWYCTLYIE